MFFNPIELLFGLLIFFVSKFFFVFLILGALMFLDPPARETAEKGTVWIDEVPRSLCLPPGNPVVHERRNSRVIPTIVVSVGALGAIHGIPYWYALLSG